MPGYHRHVRSCDLSSLGLGGNLMPSFSVFALSILYSKYSGETKMWLLALTLNFLPRKKRIKNSLIPVSF